MNERNNFEAGEALVDAVGELIKATAEFLSSESGQKFFDYVMKPRVGRFLDHLLPVLHEIDPDDYPIKHYISTDMAIKFLQVRKKFENAGSKMDAIFEAAKKERQNEG